MMEGKGEREGFKDEGPTQEDSLSLSHTNPVPLFILNNLLVIQILRWGN